MKRRWIVAPWLTVIISAAVIAFVALNADTGRARAATQNFGPKEAEVTIEDGMKTVHLTSSKFLWQFRDDQPPEEVWGYNEQIPGPTLRFRAGDKVRIYYTNHLDEASTVHWHGLIVPNSMDGVGGADDAADHAGRDDGVRVHHPQYARHVHVPRAHGRHGTGGEGAQRRASSSTRATAATVEYDQDHIVLLNNINGHYLINGKEFPNIDPWLVKKGDLMRRADDQHQPDRVPPDAFPRPLHEGDLAGWDRRQQLGRRRRSRRKHRPRRARPDDRRGSEDERAGQRRLDLPLSRSVSRDGAGWQVAEPGAWRTAA